MSIVDKILQEASLEERRYTNWRTESEELKRNHSWVDFLAKFNAARKEAWKKANPEAFKYVNSKDQAFNRNTAFQQPVIKFIDEYQHEKIDSEEISTYRDVRNYDDNKPHDRIEIEGAKNVEFGDICVNFRWATYYFKGEQQGDQIVYKYNGSSVYKGETGNMWADQSLFVNMIKSLKIVCDKHEVPVIYREKAPQKIRNYGDPGAKYNKQNSTKKNTTYKRW